MSKGLLLRLPLSGGVLDQDDNMLALMRIAWRIWFIEVYKPEAKLPHTDEDTDFMRAVLGIKPNGR